MLWRVAFEEALGATVCVNAADILLFALVFGASLVGGAAIGHTVIGPLLTRHL